MASGWLTVGRVLRAHGIKGELTVHSDNPTESALLSVKTVKLSGDPEGLLRKVVRARPTPQGVLLVLEGVNDRNGAEALRQRDVLVDRKDLPEAEEGEFYYADLEGLLAEDEQGKPLGQVKGVWETGPVPVLVIGEGANELLVPFAEQFVVKVDLPGRRVVIRPPEYTE